MQCHHFTQTFDTFKMMTKILTLAGIIIFGSYVSSFLSLKRGTSQKLNKIKLAFLKMTRTVIYYYRRQPYFFYRTFI